MPIGYLFRHADWEGRLARSRVENRHGSDARRRPAADQQFMFPDPLPRPDAGAASVSADMLPPPLGVPRPLPLWLHPSHARHIVKGNLMALSARPETVEPGEWIAHQVVEHYRNLWNFVRVVHDKEDDGTAICNASTCPKMSAGENRSYTWLNRNREPVDLPAHEYMALMQRWISGKIDDDAVFPTDPAGVSFAPHPELARSPAAEGGSGSGSGSVGVGREEWLGGRSGFPRQFVGTAQLVFRQIFRVHAHLYWDHFVAPFYHLGLEKQLNSCFSHFVLTASTLDLLQPEELEPMRCLIDVWAADGTFPRGSKAYTAANVERGRYMMGLAR
ncbi:hypothetical protein UVI_02014820 [Ustilaginoidea virens]|uniref:Maintenance of ploidy protein mob2 n=1 Tax=Ustilaginoidea virens TaxID=1159556 RepID=A0A1B5L8S1_USTVR|nr:hypothetical protein UVI_02014820 [Ustilaginoidea virens]